MAIPIQCFSSLLSLFLLQPGITDELEKWRSRPKSDLLQTIQDGHIWKESESADGQLFFSREERHGELRLGVVASLDWQVFMQP